MHRLGRKDFLNNLKINQKFLVIYILCVIIPLILTDGVILTSLFSEEMNSNRRDRESEAASYMEYIRSTVEYDVLVANAINKNAIFQEFINTEYESAFDYISAYSEFQRSNFFKSLNTLKIDKITVYVDNSSILNGSNFHQLYLHYDDTWYKKFNALDTDEALLVFNDDSENIRLNGRKKFMYVKRFKAVGNGKELIITIENDIGRLGLELKSLSSKSPMFIKCNDDYIPFSNVAVNDYEAALNEYLDTNSFVTTRFYQYRYTDFTIYVFSDELLVLKIIAERWWIIVVLLLFTLVIPVLIMKLVEKSIVRRINELQVAFGGDDSGTFIPITNIEGSDEFADLMRNYNKIVSVNNDLINTVYIDKLREQESDIARKNAEVLALQSQINPHFLFNALESIRMHSMLKGEDETAEMIEKLALMERQNCEWGNDSVAIRKEVESIEAYLYLQSYRFGDRLSFDIDIEPDCENIQIPKLTLVTFVENACVHGIESKSSQGWIFVRVYKKSNLLYIEVEDTGDGMDEAEVERMCKSMNSVTIDSLKKHKRVGMLNACLRIKMMFDNSVKFDIESEKGVGLSVVITIPVDKLKE